MNEDYPKSLLEFEERFANEGACLSYLSQLRWANGFVCPVEGAMHGRHVTVSFTAVNVDDKPHQQRVQFFIGRERILGFGSYQTAWEWLHKLRRAMVRPSRNALSGVVEVDETYIGGAKSGKRGRGAAGKSLVAVAIELKRRSLDEFVSGRLQMHRQVN